jgi:hypothetical protein
MVLSVDREASGAKSRLVHISLLDLNLRLMENWRSGQIASAGKALDYESLMILMAIIVISAERLLRTELDVELQTLQKRLPRRRAGSANLSSIAAATAINRETVRRKVNSLQKAGLLVRDKDGVRTAHGVIEYEVLRAIIDAQLDAITRTVNQLSRLGVLSDQPR